MLKYHFITSIRFFIRNRAFSLLSFFGLLIGFAFALALLAYINFEESYDTFHFDGEKVFRLQLGEEAMAPKLFPSLAPSIEEKFSGCTTVRLKPATGSIGRDQTPYKEQKMYWADVSFFNVFTYPLKYGDASVALSNSNSAVITSQLCERLFGDDGDHRGEVVIFSDLYNKEILFTVTGIIHNVPENSHLTFDALLSFETLPESQPDYQYGWSWRGIYSYVRVNDKERKHEIEQGYARLIDQIKNTPNNSINPGEALHLVPLTDVHFLQMPNDAEQYGSVEVVYSIAAFATIVFVISLFNYLNIGSVSAVSRYKEIGVKKVVGAKTFHLVSQFLIETITIFAAAALMAFLLFTCLHAGLRSVIKLQDPVSLVTDPTTLGLICFSILLGAMVSAAYLGFLLRKLSPASIVRSGGFSLSIGSPARWLMGLQFIIALLLIICAFATHNQIRFMASKKLGIDIENVVVIKPVRNANSNAKVVAGELANLVGVVGLTATSQVPGKRFNSSLWGIACEDKKYVAQEDAEYNLIETDENFVKTFGLTVRYGRNFVPGEEKKLLINATAAKLLGFGDIAESVGQNIIYSNQVFQVVGVVNDYHHLSLKENLVPILILQSEPESYFYAIKVSINNIDETLASLHQAWSSLYPGQVFDFFFVDDVFHQAYKSDRQFAYLITIMSVLVLVISFFGLAGTVIFNVQGRSKEITMRRILGGGTNDILGLFLKDNWRLVILASTLAVPLSYYCIEKWIERYPFAIAIDAKLFLLPLLTLIIFSSFVVFVVVYRMALKRRLTEGLK